MVASVEIVDVAPRDGLQSEQSPVATEVKLELIARLADAGVRRVEATSFVDPTRVPQMADADELMAALPERDDLTTIGLVLNDRGFDRAVAAGVDQITTVVVVSETFSQRNQGMSTGDAVDVWHAIADRARDAGIGTSVTLSAAFGCPFEGEVDPGRLLEVCDAVVEEPPDEIAVADTIGVAVPTDVTARVGAVVERNRGRAVRCHFHDTRNTALANIVAALDAGASVIDASVGGIGGCPFAPAATGNVATEDVVYALERMGIDTGVDLDALIAAARWLEDALGHPVPSMLSKAGPWPDRSGQTGSA